MPKVRIELCPSCTTKLADLRNAHGQKAMGEAAGAVIAACRQCAHHFPTNFDTGSKLAPQLPR